MAGISDVERLDRVFRAAAKAGRKVKEVQLKRGVINIVMADNGDAPTDAANPLDRILDAKDQDRTS
jgi:hypothetical protein